jgi:fatty-acyl-CoA synthase
MSLYVEQLAARLAMLRQTVCIVEGDRSIPASMLLEATYRYARALESLGISKGDVVALLAPNRWEALAVRYAANLLGAGATFLSVLSEEEQRMALLAIIKPALLVVFPETRHLVLAGESLSIVLAGTSSDDGVPSLDERAAAFSAAHFESRARPGDLAVISSSGGSTGIPKGSRRNFASYTAMVDVPSPLDRRQLINGPLANLSQVLADVTLIGGGTIVFQPHYDAAETLAAIASQRITDFFLVEPQLFELMDHPSLPATDLSSLRTLTHIGASAPPTLRLRARERFGPITVHAYGASEEGLVSMLQADEHDLAFPKRFASAGRVLPGVELRLRKRDGSIAREGEVGAIEVRSPAMAEGYRNRPDLEAQAFIEGWYRSGDLGYRDTEQYLHILGRADDFEPGATPITPTMVEDTLCRTASVRYVSILVDREYRRWYAFVIPWPDRPVDIATCELALKKAYGTPFTSKVVVLCCHAIPLTSQGKPDRETMLKIAHANIEFGMSHGF